MNIDKFAKIVRYTLYVTLVLFFLFAIFMMFSLIYQEYKESKMCDEIIGQEARHDYIDETHYNCCYDELKHSIEKGYYKIEICKGFVKEVRE